MKTSTTLLTEFLALSLRDPEMAAAMFAEDGVFEMPYLTSFGHPGAYYGRRAIADFFRFVTDLYPGLEFENVNVLMETSNQVFAEYEFAAKSSITGRDIRQLFFGRIVEEGGQIKLLREALNAVEVVRAVLPQGVPDIPTDAPWSPNL